MLFPCFVGGVAIAAHLTGSSFVWMSRGSTGRDILLPDGVPGMKCNYEGTLLATRAAFLMMLAMVLGSLALLEQPVSSTLMCLDRYIELTSWQKACVAKIQL